MSGIAQVGVGLLALLGTTFITLASIGILRMPDLYSRMQTSTKASTLGIICTMSAAAAYHYHDPSTVFHALGICLFLFLTAPISAHVLCRAGVLSGVPMAKGHVMNDLNQHSKNGENNHE